MHSLRYQSLIHHWSEVTIDSIVNDFIREKKKQQQNIIEHLYLENFHYQAVQFSLIEKKRMKKKKHMIIKNSSR